MEITINGHPQNMQVLGWACFAFVVAASLWVICAVYCWLKDR
jgi:hypothetical protein